MSRRELFLSSAKAALATAFAALGSRKEVNARATGAPMPSSFPIAVCCQSRRRPSLV